MTRSAILAAMLSAGLLVPAMPVAAQRVAITPKPGEDLSWLPGLVAAEDALGTDRWRAAKLAQSSRRHEAVSIRGANGPLAGFVVYPDAPAKAPVVLMVPEDQGLNDWARGMADEIAAMGYVVVVPDLLSGLGPNGGNRDSFPDLGSVFVIHSRLPGRYEPMLTAELNDWADWAKALPQANGQLATVGFAWGGGRTLAFATQRHDIAAAFIFYDAAPPPEALARLTVPLYGFYATIDPRVTASLPETEAAMKRLGKRYEPVVYPGSEHMFVRLGDEPRNKNPANIAARNAALARLQRLLAAM